MTHRWINPRGGDWNDPDNWSPAAVPGSGSAVVFDLEAGYQVEVDGFGDTIVDSLDVDAGEVTLNFTPPGDGSGTGVGLFASNSRSVGTRGKGAILIVRGGTLNGNNVLSVGADGTLWLASNGVVSGAPGGWIGFKTEPGGQVIGNGGSLEGRRLENHGILNPGDFNGPGILGIGLQTLSGLEQAPEGRLHIVIQGPTPGTGYGVLRGGGGMSPFELAGTLSVELLLEYRPPAGTRFMIIENAGSRQGTFAKLELPAGFEVEYNDHDVVLVVR